MIAHADYDCCAICDCEISYVGRNIATTKKEICEGCLKKLQEMCIEVTSVDELINWIQTENKDVLKSALKELNFYECYFYNEVDEAVLKRGLQYDKETGKIREKGETGGV